MNSQRKHALKTVLLSIAIPLVTGGLAALLTMEGMRRNAALQQPSLAPPNWVFPIVWTILYVLMGISCAMVYLTPDDNRNDALRVYALQLFLNFGWTILYFGFGLLLASFVWIVLLEAVVVVMLALFVAVRPTAGYLQIPYALWGAFAAYLNLSVWLFNA